MDHDYISFTVKGHFRVFLVKLIKFYCDYLSQYYTQILCGPINVFAGTECILDPGSQGKLPHPLLWCRM